MAAKKPTTKAAKVTSIEDLRSKLETKCQDLDDAKRSHKAGELVNPRVISATRKDIARLHTAIRSSELKETK